MKKILLLLLLLPYFLVAQTSTGQEQEFDYGIKNNASQTVTTADYLTTTGTDGTQGKILPANLPVSTAQQTAIDAKVADFINDNATTIAPSQNAVYDALQLKQTVFTGISQSQFLTENDIVIDNTARTLTIATVKNGEAISGSNPVEFFTDGNGVSVKHTKTSPVVFSFTDTTGVWYFYFNSSGTAIASQTAPTDASTIAMVYRIYWNAALATADKRVIESIEVYKNDGSWIDREWKNTQGAQYASGLNISSNVIASGTPAVDGSNAVINLSSGTIIDNNFSYTLTNSASGTTKFTQDLGSGLLPATSGKFITITNNASLVLDKIPATDFPFLWNSGTNTPEYLTQLGVRTAVTNNYFFVYYVYALQDPRRGETIKIKSAEIDFANATLAEAHTWAQLQNLFPTLRDSKIRLLYKLTFEYKSAYDVGTKKSALRKVDDLRKQRITTSATVGGTVPASIVTFSPSGNIASTNVQLAIEELDAEKTPNTRLINTTSPIVGGGDLSTDRTISIPAATTSVNGYLSSTDWNTFNNKAPLTSPTFTGTVTLPSTTSIGTVSSTEIGYVDGVTSAIQTQLDNKAPLTGGTGYIQNQNASAQSANMWINGTGRFQDEVTITGNLKGLTFDNPASQSNGLTFKTSGNPIWSINKGAGDGSDNWNFFNFSRASKDFSLSNSTGAATFASTVTASNGTLIGGTLTSGYIPKATGANSLGNSSIFDNGTNVGIGTTNPSHFLTILGSDSTLPSLGSNGGKFGLLNGTGGGQYGLISGILNNGNAYQQVQRIDGTATAYNLLLQPNGGNVGIGTTNPSVKLTVQDGEIKVRTANFVQSTTGTALTIGVDQASQFGRIAVGKTGETISAPLALQEFGGNVLVNTTTDDGVNKLQVNGSGKFTDGTSQTTIAGKSITFYNAASSNASIKVSDDSNTINVIEFAKAGSTANVIIPVLSGTGTRTVVADSSGNLSATDAVPTSGNFTPTVTDGSGSSGATLVRASYQKVGNIVTAYYSVNTTSTSSTAFITVNVTLPVNRTNSTTLDIGIGSVYVNTGGGTNFAVTGQSIATNSVNLIFKPTAAVSCNLTASIQYSVLE